MPGDPADCREETARRESRLSGERSAGREAGPDGAQTGLGHRLGRRALRVTRLLFTPVAIVFLLYFGWQSRSELEGLFGSANPGLLLIAILAWSAMNLLGPVLATVVFRGLGYELGYGKAARIHIRNLPARYLPGGIWHTVGRIVDYRRTGIKDRDLATFFLLENALALATALLIGGSLVGWFRGLQGWGLAAVAGAVVGSAILILLPLGGRFHVPNYVTRLAVRGYVTGAAVMAVSWSAAAGGFSAFVSAFPDLPPAVSPLELAGIYLLSWAIGFIAIFAPQGIGVFEFVAAEMIHGSYSLANTAVLLAMLRLVILIADGAVWACGMLFFRMSWQNRAGIGRGGAEETRSRRTQNPSQIADPD